MKKILYILIVVLCLLSPITSVYAEYVLPYPSYMPGNKVYRITRFVDSLKKYWSFGNITQTKYRMGLADKYLVEAKTLMEYKQYLLGIDALKRSNEQILLLKKSLASAKNQYGNLNELQAQISEEMKKHIETLLMIGSLVPGSVRWMPAKSAPTDLNISDMLSSSVAIRTDLSGFLNN